MGIEEYLISKGYVKHIYNCKTGKMELPGEFTILSTMGNLDWRFLKDGFKTIVYGLNECGKPPVFIYPRPVSLIVSLNGFDDGSDSLVHRVFSEYSLDEIYESICE